MVSDEASGNGRWELVPSAALVETTDSSPRHHAHPGPPASAVAASRVAVIDDFAAYSGSLAAAIERVSTAEVSRYHSHDAALGDSSRLRSHDLIFVDVYRHASERELDPYLAGVGVKSVAQAVARWPDAPRLVAYGTWAQRPEVRALVAQLEAVGELYDSGVLLDHVDDALSGTYEHASAPVDADDHRAIGVGPKARLVEAIDVAVAAGAEPGEPFGECWRWICELDIGEDSRRVSGVPESVRRTIGRRLLPLLDLPDTANYLDAVRIIQRVAAVGPR